MVTRKQHRAGVHRVSSRIKSYFRTGTPEGMLLWAIVETALHDLKYKHSDAYQFLTTDENYPALLSGVEPAWIKRVIHECMGY